MFEMRSVEPASEQCAPAFHLALVPDFTQVYNFPFRTDFDPAGEHAEPYDTPANEGLVVAKVAVMKALIVTMTSKRERTNTTLKVSICAHKSA